MADGRWMERDGGYCLRLAATPAAEIQSWFISVKFGLSAFNGHCVICRSKLENMAYEIRINDQLYFVICFVLF